MTPLKIEDKATNSLVHSRPGIGATEDRICPPSKKKPPAEPVAKTKSTFVGNLKKLCPL